MAKYYVLVDGGYGQYSRWEAKTLNEALKIQAMLRNKMLEEDTEIVKCVSCNT